MYLQSEQEFFSGPRLAPPPPTALHATRADYPRFKRSDVPVFYGVLAASTHQEFAYVGPEAHLPASAAGQRVATYYALAWLDRWLAHKHKHKSGVRRLLADRFGRSVDISAIGLGHWNPFAQSNEPRHLAGSPPARRSPGTTSRAQTSAVTTAATCASAADHRFGGLVIKNWSRVVDDWGMSQEHPRCCGHDMRAISIGVPAPTGLMLYLCDRCRRSDWRRNGIPVTPRQALETARALDEAITT